MRRISVAILLVIATAACGDGGGDEADRTAAESESAGASTEFCDGLVEVQSSEPEVPEGATEEQAMQAQQDFFEKELVPAVEQLGRVAPDSLKEDIASVVTLLNDEGPAAFGNPRFAELNTGLNASAIDECDFEKVSVAATEYEFAGLPDRVEAGPIGFIFENKGQEPHEMVLLKRNDGVADSVDDLLAMPQEELQTKLEPFGGYQAPPGGRDARVVELPAGKYVVACFVPVGGGEDGPPHTTKGMVAEFVVE